jgi:apolipoprotein N-acyltransferase
MFTYKSLLTPLLFTLFIYFEYFELSLKLINTIIALSAFLLVFQLTKKELFLNGFIIGILWFWWLSYSFIYYELNFLIPVVLVGIGLLYGILFYLIGIFNNIYYKISYIFLLSYIEPFNFNWFKIELPFINSYLGTSKFEFLSILIISALFIEFRYKYKKTIPLSYASVIILLFFINKYNISQNEIKLPPLKIYKYETTIPQEQKWDRKYKKEIIENNFNAIQLAIKNKNDLIILPETAFPLILNHQPILLNKLLEYSEKISIITGSLYEKDTLLYNSSYLFQNGTLKVANKVVLVPFGEAVPMPEKIKNWINDTFYDGAKDYITASTPTTFTINNTKFRNAICYEATTDKIYANMDTKYTIAISNNGWFTPSIQPTLQKLLMKYYENKYSIMIIDVSNK